MCSPVRPVKSSKPTIQKMLDDAGIEGSKVKAEGDLFELQQWIKEEKVDLMIGTTYGKYIARAEDIPLVRFGFPILDRAVHPLMPVVGYRGCLRLIEQISDALLERRDRDCARRGLRTGTVKTLGKNGGETFMEDSCALTAAAVACIDERQDSIQTAGKSRTRIHCADDSLAGSVSQRACVFCGARVVLNPVTDAVHLVHGPIGCATYTWISGAACQAVRSCTGTVSRPT